MARRLKFSSDHCCTSPRTWAGRPRSGENCFPKAERKQNGGMEVGGPQVYSGRGGAPGAAPHRVGSGHLPGLMGLLGRRVPAGWSSVPSSCTHFSPARPQPPTLGCASFCSWTARHCLTRSGLSLNCQLLVSTGWVCWDPLRLQRAFLVTQMVQNLPAMQETWAQSLGWEDPLEEGMATHSSILAWRIPMDRRAWRATVHGVPKSRTRLND